MSDCSESLLRLWGQPPQGGGDQWLASLASLLCDSGQSPNEVVMQARFVLAAWYVKRNGAEDVERWCTNPDNAARLRKIIMKGLAKKLSEAEILSGLETYVLRVDSKNEPKGSTSPRPGKS